MTTDLQILKNAANTWGSVAEPGAVDWVSMHPPSVCLVTIFIIKLVTDLQILKNGANIRSRSWDRSYGLGIQYYLPTSICFFPSFSHSVLSGDWPADSPEWWQYIRFRSWARSCKLGIQYYPPTSVCCSLPSFSIKLATDLQILKNGANIWGSVAEPGAVGSVSNTIHPPQSVVLYLSFSIKWWLTCRFSRMVPIYEVP